MRLTDSEIQTIKQVVSDFIPHYELYLHGSRLDDSMKGGDIDLFLIVPDKDLEPLKLKKHYLQSKLLQHMREQRIDLTIISQSESLHNDFFINSDKIRI